MSPRCPACDSPNLSTAVEITDMPAHVGVLWPSEEEARRCPTGDMRLLFCHSCGYLHNAAFDEGLVDYELSYDNALHHSDVFRKYEVELAKRLVQRYSLRGKLIVEIGCGPAHFLGLMCQLGDNRGLGFDPSHDPAYLDELADGRVEVRREYYTDESADVDPDLVCARHVLEHIANPTWLLGTLRRTLARSEATLYFEVPNALLALEQLSIWDLMYEHCGYYTSGSLQRLFRAQGFHVIDVGEAYDGQFVSIEARPGDAESQSIAPDELDRMKELVDAFSAHVVSIRNSWDVRLRNYAASEANVVVWGAGGKGVSFMNLLSESAAVSALVDVNPRKQGMYLAGTGHRILPPESLAVSPPDVIVVMNPLYLSEITEQARRMGLDQTTIESVS